MKSSGEAQAAPQNEAQVLTIYSLRNANAEEMAKLIQRVVDFPLRVAADVRTNALVIQAPADKGDDIAALVERLDAPLAAPAP